MKEKRPSLPLLLWERYQARKNDKAFVAKCKRIILDEYGVDVKTVDHTLLSILDEIPEMSADPAKRPFEIKKVLTYLHLFSRGLTHKEGVDFGTGLYNICPANEKLEGRGRRINALLRRSDQEGFFQALNRLIPLDRTKTLTVDVARLDYDLFRYYRYDDDSVTHRWVSHLYPKTTAATPNTK